MGRIKENTTGIINKEVVFEFYWPQDGSNDGNAVLKSNGSIFTPTENSVSYRIYGDAKTWLQGTISNSFSRFNTNISDVLRVTNVTPSGLPSVGVGGLWEINIRSTNWLSLPSSIRGLYSEFTVTSWAFNTIGKRPGRYTDIIHTWSGSTGYRNFTINYEVVNSVNPECKLILSNGSSITDSINLGTIISGQEKTSEYKIKLQCKDVYQANITFRMDDVISGSNGYKTQTVPGGFLQIRNDENNLVKLDGSTPEYIINPLDTYKSYSIINNAESVTRAGRFVKRLTLVLKIN
ncbi:hypothetical protein UA42_19840 [Photobacterium kishitanii]|uniref:hypothetical protein n=1 Tax=Photobacterium kishitanii TaxID=318456 RepID=UPI0005D44B41|nr:hypothetical protein [Photobacterium kishitanii]KJG58418.1 hypothetical protein UA42_19840 [Photobacterium kishitanii]KJG63860.1 hypothetical protein UA40_19845 [Photobacterium kishitanii]KJG67349.1 hypothetical protein UA41_19420 [Photobacterium kishitanii]